MAKYKRFANVWSQMKQMDNVQPFEHGEGVDVVERHNLKWVKI